MRLSRDTKSHYCFNYAMKISAASAFISLAYETLYAIINQCILVWLAGYRRLDRDAISQYECLVICVFEKSKFIIETNEALIQYSPV